MTDQEFKTRLEDLKKEVSYHTDTCFDNMYLIKLINLLIESTSISDVDPHEELLKRAD